MEQEGPILLPLLSSPLLPPPSFLFERLRERGIVIDRFLVRDADS